MLTFDFKEQNYAVTAITLLKLYLHLVRCFDSLSHPDSQAGFCPVATFEHNLHQWSGLSEKKYIFLCNHTLRVEDVCVYICYTLNKVTRQPGVPALSGLNSGSDLFTRLWQGLLLLQLNWEPTPCEERRLTLCPSADLQLFCSAGKPAAMRVIISHKIKTAGPVVWLCF